MNNRLRMCAVAFALVAVAACSGHGGMNPPMNGLGGGLAPAFAWGQEQLAGAALVGPAQFAHLQVNVLVNQQNAQGLVAYAQQASDSSSPVYRHWLTPQQIGQRFGATLADYQKTAKYFTANGLHVTGWPQRITLAVAGSQPALERAFGTKFGVYELNGQRFIAPMTPPRPSFALPIAAVQNLVTLSYAHTFVVPPRAGAGVSLGYSPQQVRKAFDFDGAYAGGYSGANITVGIIGTGPINVNRTTWCGDADLSALQALYNAVNAAQVCEVNVTPNGVAAGLSYSGIPTASPAATQNPTATPTPNTSYFPYSGDFQTPPPVTGPCSGTLPSCNPEDLEAQLDTQQIATLAPGAAVHLYLAYNASDCFTYFPDPCASPAPGATPKGSNYGQPQIGIVEADPEIQQVIADNTADVISLSYSTGGEPQNIGGPFNSSGIGYGPEEFAALASEGVAVFVSSGDNGAAECLGAPPLGYVAQPCVAYPAGDVNVSSVGGVNVPIDEFGRLVGTITAWGYTTSLGTSGSGGGVSTVFNAPAWQQSAIGAAKRTQPDVSLIGDPFTGVTVYVDAGFGGGPGDVGGTSVAAPQMAATWALVLSAECQKQGTCGNPSHAYRLGNAAPYLYSIYKGSNLTGGAFTPLLPYNQVFYDVVYGGNSMCSSPPSSTPCFAPSPVPGATAGPGYDQVTGVGVPFAGHLIDALVSGANAP
jgi:subtilase family serine protease